MGLLVNEKLTNTSQIGHGCHNACKDNARTADKWTEEDRWLEDYTNGIRFAVVDAPGEPTISEKKTIKAHPKGVWYRNQVEGYLITNYIPMTDGKFLKVELVRRTLDD